MSITTVIRGLPVVGPVARRLKAHVTKLKFRNSSHYWEQRYANGGTSGAGSYNQLARFKAEFLNGYVRENRISSVIEFGVGDGAQLELAKYPCFVGVDVSRTVVNRLKERFSKSENYIFYHTSEIGQEVKCDLSLSLDVIYHLVEDPVFEDYMRKLFDAATKAVIVYASNEDRAWSGPHVRHRHFTNWVDKNRPDFHLVQHVPNIYPWQDDDQDNTSFADFFVFTRLAA